jgi:hypothetical protein
VRCRWMVGGGKVVLTRFMMDGWGTRAVGCAVRGRCGVPGGDGLGRRRPVV